jgi:hypothetical protein
LNEVEGGVGVLRHQEDRQSRAKNQEHEQRSSEKHPFPPSTPSSREIVAPLENGEKAPGRI